MNRDIKEIRKDVKFCIKENKMELWRSYYTKMPYDRVYKDMVIDIREIKKLQTKYVKLVQLLEQDSVDIIQENNGENISIKKTIMDILKGVK